MGLRYDDVTWEYAEPTDRANPNCIPCIFLQFKMTEHRERVSKVLQVFSRQVNETLKTEVSVYEKFQATRAKVALVNLIYGSNFSATEATYKVSQNIKKIVKSLYLQEVDIVRQSYFI